MSQSRTIVGIDPGLNGGLAVLRDRKVVLAERMPLRVISGVDGRERRNVDGEAIARVVEAFAPDIVVVEDSYGRHGDGPAGAHSFGGTWWIVIDRVREPEPIVVPAKTWQKAILRPFMAIVPKRRQKSDGTIVEMTGREMHKAASVLFVRQQYPDANLTPGRCTEPHDGISDAVCIAAWGEMQADAVTIGHVPPKTHRRGPKGRRKDFRKGA